ncbi:MAG: hypothetical protein GY759_14515 [Chloroflexi bacterium]|nr:hypothetical protein [Chloroflexota bacterium]
MYHLATLFPGIRRFRIPLTRDQLILLIVATNELFLALDIYLAHSISGTIVPREWIPIIFGLVAFVLLVFAGIIATRRRNTASIIATLTLIASILVGFLGAYFHIVRAALLAAPLGDRLTVQLMIWAPPIVGPLMFVFVGIFGISAAWLELPSDSGSLRIIRGLRLNLPYSKTRAFFYVVGLASLVTVFSAVYDHARTDFENPYLWIPTVFGLFASVCGIALGAIRRPTFTDLMTFFVAMILLIFVGAIGFFLHTDSNLVADNVIVMERFIRGAPFLAPLLFCNLGLLGIITMLDPVERR